MGRLVERLILNNYLLNIEFIMTKNIYIAGLGAYVPKRKLTNQDLEKMVDTTDEWIVTRTGIKERRIAAANEKTSDLATQAAHAAMTDAKLEVEELDLIIVATISPDSNFPSVACLVQKNIGAVNAVAFDVSAACSGYLFALTTAKKYLESGLYKNALVIAAEKITSLVDWNDRGTCVLFGDGSGASVLKTTTEDKGILSEYLHAQGEFGNLMEVRVQERTPLDQEAKMMSLPLINMQGQELFKVAVNSMANGVEVAVKKAGLQLSDIKCVVPHQANDRIISAVAKKLKLPKDMIFINIHKYGNMSAASIAVALCEAKSEGRIKEGDHVALVTFGAGLVTAANIVKF